MTSLERARVSDSPFFAQFQDILGQNKIVVITCKGKEIRVIDGSIGNDEKGSGFVNVEIDFPDGKERYRVYPFGVNRIISDRQSIDGGGTSRLGIPLNDRSRLSWGDDPKPHMDHDRIAQTVYELVIEYQRIGTVETFRQAADYRRTLPVLVNSSPRKRLKWPME